MDEEQDRGTGRALYPTDTGRGTPPANVGNRGRKRRSVEAELDDLCDHPLLQNDTKMTIREEAEYYLRFTSMYIDLGSEVLLKVFIHHTPGKDAESFLLSNTSKLQQLKHDKILTKQESNLVLTSKPNPKYFDVSLLITLSIRLFSEEQLPPPIKGWFIPPRNSDTSIAADLLRLRTIRNCIIGHCRKAQLPKWRFEDEWRNVKEIFLRLYSVVAPGERTKLKERINDYRLRKFDLPIENQYDSKLHEWEQQISEIQQQVEDAFKSVKDIDAYFKSKSDRYERYIKLLVKGGRFVILALLEDNLKAQNKNLRDILRDKEDNVRKSIDNLDHLQILYPPGQGNRSDPIDMSTWDITLLITVLLKVLDNSSFDDEVKEAIINIDTARKSYAEAAVVSLDSDAFAEYSYPLKYSIQFLSRYLDRQKKIECEEIVSECKSSSMGAGEHHTYFDELKNQSIKIKSIQEIYKDKIKKTKEVLQEMINCGIDFKQERVLEYKMITLGCDENKKQIGENVLAEIWQAALERSGDSTDFDVVKKEVLEIITEIRKPKGVTEVDVKQKCILLGITCLSPCTFLCLLDYFESTEFNRKIQSISSELGYLFNTCFAIQGNVTLESLEEIHTDKEYEHVQDKGISILITITSPEAIMQLGSLFDSKAMMKSTDKIANSLSKYLKETVTLKISHDMGHIYNLIDDLESENPSSESLSNDAMHLEEPGNDGSIKVDANQRLSTAGQKAIKSSEEIDKTELELDMQQKEEIGTVIDSVKEKKSEETDEVKTLKSNISDEVKKITEDIMANKDDAYNKLKEGHDEAEQKRHCLNMADIEQLWSAGKKNRYLKECDRICTFIKNKSDKIVYVWPAYDTNEEKTLIFVCMATENVEVDVEYRLCIRIVGQYSEEGERVMRNPKNAENRLSAKQSEKICNVINLLADTLMQNHRFISIITGSGVRSVRFATKKEEIIPEACVVIYVVIKGKIPLDEKEIPKSLEGIPVDIREGDFQTSVLAASAFHTNVQMGCQIMSSGNQYGTLGGFVEHPKFGFCGITCAHVVINEQEMHNLVDKENVELSQRNVYQPDNTHPDHIVGPVKDVTYNGGGDGVPGIDLAVFQIKNRPPECGNFPGISEKDLVYESGKLGVENQFMTDDKQVVKFGSRSGFTRGHVAFCATSVREIKYTDYTRKYTVENNEYTYTLHNQLEIEPSFYGPFNIGGDSGGLVFTKDVTENWICIGMVVGAYTNGNGIVTPISAIKRQLGVSEFKSFTSNKIDRLAKQMKTMETYMQMICSKLGIEEIAVTSRAPANQGQNIHGGQKDNTHVYSHSEGCQ